jgi:hypothetical protein
MQLIGNTRILTDFAQKSPQTLNPISFADIIFWCPFLDPHLNTYHSNLAIHITVMLELHTPTVHWWAFEHTFLFQGVWVLFGSIFMLSSFYRLHSHNQACVTLVDLWWNICKNGLENQTSPYLVMVIRMNRFFLKISLNWTHMSSHLHSPSNVK